MVLCEYTRCGRLLEISDFKSQDVYPCCGMQVLQKIDFPAIDTEELLEVPEPLEEKVKEKVVKEKPAKKAAAKKKPAKKAKK